jgi:hypothetical protein
MFVCWRLELYLGTETNKYAVFSGFLRIECFVIQIRYLLWVF